MNIDKSKLKIGLWYEDKDENIIPHDKKKCNTVCDFCKGDTNADKF